MLCNLGADTCQELHQLEKCEQFKKMSPEQRMVKVNELRLCLINMRHSLDKECYQKAKAEYKVGSESR
jgi:ribosomal protein L29